MTYTQDFCLLLFCLPVNLYENNMDRKGKELCTNVRNMIVKAYRENKNTLKLKRTLGIFRSTVRSIVKKLKKRDILKINKEGEGRECFQTEIKTNFRA